MKEFSYPQFCGKEKKLKEFSAFLLGKNAQFNLTAAKSEEELEIKHLLDSVLGAEFIPHGAKCADIGSGGGFPAVPLAIIREDINYTLIEATSKKCEFLKEAANLLGLKNVRVECGRAEEMAKGDMRESFGVVTARAVARLNTLCEYCLPFVEVGGLFIAYKGPDGDREAQEAEGAISVLGGKLLSINRFSLPLGEGERKIVVIEKISGTPLKFPRGKGKERKDPL